MRDISGILPGLVELALEHPTSSFIFGFEFRGLVTRGIFFGGPMTLLVGISGWNTAWQTDVSDGRMSESIPEEAYFAIGSAMVDDGGVRTNAPYFLMLETALRETVGRGMTSMAMESDMHALLS